jgi:hypothetical protein
MDRQRIFKPEILAAWIWMPASGYRPPGADTAPFIRRESEGCGAAASVPSQ